MTENVSNSSSARNTYIVSACIFLSRIFGLLREVLLAFFLGTSIYSDAFKAALKIPNILQNLFGEGVLSASFIPEYVRLIKNEKKNEAILLAKQSGLLLLITAFILAGIGMYFNSEIVNLFAPGFSDETKALTKNLLLILFPATAILMLSAWCLGILNSHRHFLLSYSAPLFWNISIISGLLLLFTPYFKTYSMSELIIHISLFVLIGSILQLAVQLKKTFSLIKHNANDSKESYFPLSSPTKAVIKGFIPVSLGRGVVQISAYIDTIIASLLQAGSLSVLAYAQAIFLLPISVFGMAVSAAELPDLSESKDNINNIENKKSFINRLDSAKERLFFYIFPCFIIFIFLGHSLISFVYKSGNFSKESVMQVSLMLAILSLGLIPSSFSRVVSSALYALSYHKMVSKIAVFRLIFGSLLGGVLSLIILPKYDLFNNFHVLGLGIGSSIGAWTELFVLEKFLSKKIALGSEPNTQKSKSIYLVIASSLIAGFISYYIQSYLIEYSRFFQIIPFFIFILTYLICSKILKVKELDSIINSLLKIKNKETKCL